MSWLPFWGRKPKPAVVVDPLAGGFPEPERFEGFRLADLARLPAGCRAAVLFEKAHGLSPAAAWEQYLAGRWPGKG